MAVQYEIRLCPALQNKPALPTPNFTPSEKKAFDPFAPPYNQNLFVGELRDEDNAEDYVVLVCRLCALSTGDVA